MQRGDLSGLVLTHGDRDPSELLEQMGNICDQIVLIHDNRNGPFQKDLNDASQAEITLIEREFDTFPAQRNAGIEKALGSWVLSVDSDEQLSNGLVDELSKLEPPKTVDVYGIARTEVWRNRVTRSALYCQFHPRLFRSNIRYAPIPLVHEEFQDTDYSKVVNLRQPLIHNMDESTTAIARKSFLYGRSWQADKENRTFNNVQLFGTIPNMLIRHGYWRDGVAGLCIATTQFVYRLGTRFPLDATE